MSIPQAPTSAAQPARRVSSPDTPGRPVHEAPVVRNSADQLAAALRATPAKPPLPVSWWRRLFRLGPTAAQLAAADRQQQLRSSFARTVTIVVASPKGSAGKTPTARGLAAAFGHARGGGVVVWDNNELRGTLLARSQATHQGHVGTLLNSADWFSRPEATILELERTLNRQPLSHEWVLGSDPAAQRPITPAEFDKIHKILARFYPIVIIDTGNNELALNWQAAINAADLLVVPMKWRGDHIEPAARMLEALDRRGMTTRGRSIIVGTNGQGEADPAARQSALEYFDGWPIVEIPVDPTLSRSVINWTDLLPATQAAYETLGTQLIHLLKGD